MKKINLLLLFTCVLATLTNCMVSSSKLATMTFKNGDKWIPKDFIPKKTILLVEKFTVSAKANQKMEDYMSEAYPYRYEFVEKDIIENRVGKYADTTLYKYALVWSSHFTPGSMVYGPDARSTYRIAAVTGFDYNFYDRSSDKKYPKTQKSSSYAIMTFKPVINTIVAHFE